MTENRTTFQDMTLNNAMIALEQAAWNHAQCVKALAAAEFGSSMSQHLVTNLLNAGDILRQKLTLALTHGATVEQIGAVPDLHPSYREDVELGVIQAKQ